MHTRRVRYLLQPGESLTLPERIVPQVLRVGLARDILGLDDDHLITSPAVSFPLPRYTDGAPLRGTPGVRPDALRFPFMWLPDTLRERYDITTDEGMIPESDDAWALRIAFEMWGNGLYDLDSGGWLDILALYDLDADDPATQDRISAWWDGADDADLDAIDIAPIFVPDDNEDSDWASIAALALVESFDHASMALSALDTVALCELISEGDFAALGTSDPARAVSSLVRVARSRFTALPEISALLNHLQTQADRPAADGATLVGEIVPQLNEIAQGLYLTYQPVLAEVAKSFSDENLAAAGN
ncbi:hypothetical protein [Brachybacterium kimchii]|uniref:Uncharacterized protein n=1 Tax=Brachybacterium kimchii TaxID=2942909 RepID=A0ABY4NAT3_9MICO|nr:hypothetical protein [Brachybacterium kimchii]UQN30533.1 hypothetical protein M4486_04270 [Brachybacterium kimchii]